MELKIKKFDVKLEIELLKDFIIKVESIDGEITDYRGQRAVRNKEVIIDNREDEQREKQYFIALDGSVSNFHEVMINKIGDIMREAKNIHVYKWITNSNPESAWLYARTTYNNVMTGEEIWRNGSLSYVVTFENPEGKSVILERDISGAEKLFMDGKYLGQVRMSLVQFPSLNFRYADLETDWDFWVPNGEKGIWIKNDGTFDGMVAGIGMAVDEFLKMQDN